MSTQKDSYLYQQVAKDIGDSIKAGDYLVGERLASLRTVCEQYGVSLATAIQAYQLLQDQDLVSVRAKSGYRVRDWQKQPIDVPETSQPKLKSMQVNVSQLAMSLVSEVRQSGIVKLGAAVPAENMLPLGSLARTTAGTARRHYQSVATYADTQGYQPLRQQVVRLMRCAGVRCCCYDVVITERLSGSIKPVFTRGF